MENNIKQEVNRCIKDILYYAYKNDVVFPRSCGLVSTLLTYSLKDTSLSSNYDIFLIRGIFKNINNEEDNFCEESDFLSINRSNFKKYEFNCDYCGICDYMNPHSWVELKDKKTNKIIILDFTQIQFDEWFPNFQDEILNSSWDKEELFQYIEHNSCSLIEETDIFFNYYIPTKSIISLNKLINLVNEEGSSYHNMIENFKKWKENN